MPDDLPILPTPASREEIAARNAKRLRLARQLDDRNSHIRQEAIQECQSLSPMEICNLLNMAGEAEVWQFPRWLKFVLSSLMGGVWLYLLINWISRILHAEIVRAEFGVLLIASVGMGFTGLAMNIDYPRSLYTYRLKTSLAEVIKNTQNPAFLPEAMRLLYTPLHSLQRDLTVLDQALYAAVTHWLLTLDIEQIRAFAIQHQAYYWLLDDERVCKNVQLAVRVLNILEQIGTPSAIPVVAHLSHRLVFTAKDRAVKAAAQACLTALEQRAQAYRQPEILLRASSAPEAMPDTLLRPATGSGNALPEQLLRSSHGAGKR